MCTKCREASRERHRERLRQRRRNGYDSHRDSDGIRYEKPAIQRQEMCYYCRQPFMVQRKRFQVHVCDSCISAHKEVMRVRKLNRIKAQYHKDPQKYLRRRIGYRLQRAGLSLDWYDAQGGKCAVCGATSPGGNSGNWHIDHDHSCCVDGCSKCIRGLLCHGCNTGIGLFKDDPERLLKAAAYLQKATL